jgi:hypothetical protein
LGIAQTLSERQFTHVSIGFYKRKLRHATIFGRNPTFYRYAIRRLLAVASWYIDDRNGIADVVLSNRKASRVSDIKTYMEYWSRGQDSKIRQGVYSPRRIRSMDMRDEEMLRAADVAASSIGRALNPDKTGNAFPDCAEAIASRFYRYWNGRVWSYGFWAFPCSKDESVALCPCIANWLK